MKILLLFSAVSSFVIQTQNGATSLDRMVVDNKEEPPYSNPGLEPTRYEVTGSAQNAETLASLDLDEQSEINGKQGKMDEIDFDSDDFDKDFLVREAGNDQVNLAEEKNDFDAIEETVENQDATEIAAPVKPTILDIIYDTKELSQLASLIKESPPLEEALSTLTNELTFFAPVDDAFPSREPPPSLDVLLYHIVENIYPSEAFHDGELLDSALELDTLGGETQKILVSVSEQDQDHEPIKINGHVHVIGADIQASNGVVHLVNRVITPPPNMMWMLVHSFREYAVFLLALKRSGLDSVVQFQQPGMLFAPTNSAFKKIPVSKLAYLFSPAGSAQLTLLLLGHIAPVLLYSQDMIAHPRPLVIPTLGIPISISTDKDGTISLNHGGALIVGQDLCASNGAIHGIDSVLGIEGIGHGSDLLGKPDMMQDVESSRDHSQYKDQDWYLALYPDEAKESEENLSNTQRNSDNIEMNSATTAPAMKRPRRQF